VATVKHTPRPREFGETDLYAWTKELAAIFASAAEQSSDSGIELLPWEVDRMAAWAESEVDGVLEYAREDMAEIAYQAARKALRSLEERVTAYLQAGLEAALEAKTKQAMCKELEGWMGEAGFEIGRMVDETETMFSKAIAKK
jgi:hypothetical protein